MGLCHGKNSGSGSDYVLQPQAHPTPQPSSPCASGPAESHSLVLQLHFNDEDNIQKKKKNYSVLSASENKIENIHLELQH